MSVTVFRASVIGALLYFSAAGLSPVSADDGIVWVRDLKAAQQQAAREQRPVMAYFTYDACSWCRKLETKTYTNDAVIAKSREFVWTKVNRDRDSATNLRFNVNSYPTLVALDPTGKKLHRFYGFHKPGKFIDELETALARWELASAGQEWHVEPTRPDSICDKARVETVQAPSDEFPSGVAVLGDDLWVIQRPRLYRTDKRTGEVKGGFTLRQNDLIVDLTSDGEMLYLVPYGWSAGQPVLVLDPETGIIKRRITTLANKKNRRKATKGIVYHDGGLYLLALGNLSRVDPATGDIAWSVEVEPGLGSLASSEGLLVAGSQADLVYLDPADGQVVRRVAINYAVRSVAADTESLYLMELPIFDYDKDNQRVQVWPKLTLVYRLRFEVDADGS